MVIIVVEWYVRRVITLIHGLLQCIEVKLLHKLSHPKYTTNMQCSIRISKGHFKGSYKNQSEVDKGLQENQLINSSTQCHPSSSLTLTLSLSLSVKDNQTNQYKSSSKSQKDKCWPTTTNLQLYIQCIKDVEMIQIKWLYHHLFPMSNFFPPLQEKKNFLSGDTFVF